MANFEEIVNLLRRDYTVVQRPSGHPKYYTNYGVYTNSADFVTHFRSLLPAGTTHLIVCDDVDLKFLYYRAWNMSDWFDEICVALRKSYKVTVVFSASSGMQFIDVRDMWVTFFHQQHSHEKWTHLKLFNDAAQSRIGYIGYTQISFIELVNDLRKRYNVVTVMDADLPDSRFLEGNIADAQHLLKGGSHLYIVDRGHGRFRYCVADIAQEHLAFDNKLSKYFTLRFPKSGESLGDIIELSLNPLDAVSVIRAKHPNCLHLDVHLDVHPHGLFVRFKPSPVPTFDMVVAELRTRFKVVTVAELPKFPFNVALAKAHEIELDNVDHLVVWHNNGHVYYNGWLIETQFQKVVNELQQRYTVHIITEKTARHRWTAPITDNVWGPLEMLPNWTVINIGYEAKPDGLFVYYAGNTVMDRDQAYQTITLSCSHLAFIDPPVDLNLDRLPHCPCQQPRQYKLEWSQDIKDHKVVYVEVMDKADRAILEQAVCDVCQAKYTPHGLRWRRDPRALGQATYGLFCTQCYAKAYAEMENYIKTSFVKP